MHDFYSFSLLDEQSHIKHTISTKDLSRPYACSMALHTGENPSAIIENREYLAGLFGEAYSYIVAQQMHSDHIHVVTHAQTQGWRDQNTAIANCDALITQEKNVVLTILTADCVPILLYDPIQEVIGIVHAGWKGTVAQIAAKTVEKMCDTYGCKASDILAGIAPAIGKCCYEVGEDVAQHFSHLPQAYSSKKEKYMLDLPAVNYTQLIDAGLDTTHIQSSGICTACEVERFFSYRQEQGCSGRFMSMIVLDG